MSRKPARAAMSMSARAVAPRRHVSPPTRGFATTMQPDGVHFVTTDEELRAVERLRYEGYIARMGRTRPTADHKRGLLPLPADEQSRIVYAAQDGEVIGSLRIRHGRVGPYTAEEHHAFAPDMFEPLVSVKDTVIQDTFVIRDDHLGGPLRMQLFFASAQYVLSEGVELVFCDCLPHLLRTYQRIGFRTYKTNFDSLDGLLVPLVAVVADLDYLEAIEAPLRVAFETPGVAVDRRRGRDIAGRLSMHPHVVSRAQTGRDEYFAQVFGDADGEAHPFGLFDGLSPDEIDAVMAKSNIIEAREGECLVRKGLGTCNLFLVLDGTARVQLPGGEFRDLVRGDVYGELAFFLGTRTADVVVASRSARVLCLSDSVVRRLLDGEPRLGARLAMNLGCVVAARLADDIVKR
jgi:hypothetical protein